MDMEMKHQEQLCTHKDMEFPGCSSQNIGCGSINLQPETMGSHFPYSMIPTGRIQGNFLPPYGRTCHLPAFLMDLELLLMENKEQFHISQLQLHVLGIPPHTPFPSWKTRHFPLHYQVWKDQKHRNASVIQQESIQAGISSYSLGNVRRASPPPGSVCQREAEGAVRIHCRDLRRILGAPTPDSLAPMDPKAFQGIPVEG